MEPPWWFKVLYCVVNVLWILALLIGMFLVSRAEFQWLF